MAPAAAPAPASARRRAAAPAPAASTRRRAAAPAPAASTRRRAPAPAPAAATSRRRAPAPAPAAATTRRRAHAPAPPATPPTPLTPPTPPSAGFSETGDDEPPPPPTPPPPAPAPRRRATAPAAVGDAYATPFLRQLAGRTWVERVATPERPGRLESVDELSPILSRHTENNVSEDPHAGLDEDQLAAAVAGLAAPSLRPRRAASWSAGDLSMTFNEQRRRWEGGPQVDLSGFGEDVNPRRTSRSADDAKEDAIAQEELEATLIEAEKRRDADIQRFWGDSAPASGENDAAAWLRSGDAAKALGALPEESPAPAPARRKTPAKAARRAPAPAPARRGRAAPSAAPARARTRAPAPAKARSSRGSGT